MFYNSWGSVCDDSFDNTDAQVFCRSLGLPWTESQAIYGLWEYGEGEILMDDVECQGGEDSLWDCSRASSHNCAHSEDVGVICQGGSDADSSGAPKDITVGNFRLVLHPESN